MAPSRAGCSRRSRPRWTRRAAASMRPTSSMAGSITACRSTASATTASARRSCAERAMDRRRGRPGPARSRRVWLLDLDNTLHAATLHAFPRINEAMSRYVAELLGLPEDEADALRTRYWQRYGATLLGL